MNISAVLEKDQRRTPCRSSSAWKPASPNGMAALCLCLQGWNQRHPIQWRVVYAEQNIPKNIQQIAVCNSSVRLEVGPWSWNILSDCTCFVSARRCSELSYSKAWKQKWHGVSASRNVILGRQYDWEARLRHARKVGNTILRVHGCQAASSKHALATRTTRTHSCLLQNNSNTTHGQDSQRLSENRRSTSYMACERRVCPKTLRKTIYAALEVREGRFRE